LILLKVYDYIRSMAAVREAPARRHGWDVLHIEQDLHIDWELGGNRWLTAHHAFEVFSAYWYQYAHITFAMAALLWCYVSGPQLYRRARNAVVITNLVGMTVFTFLPVMPPRLLPGTSYVDSVFKVGLGEGPGGPVEADQFAAMPSLHLAWATWTALVVTALLMAKFPGRKRWLVTLIYPGITATVVVTTANHYVLDVVAGVFVALAAIWVTGPRRPWAPVWPRVRALPGLRVVPTPGQAWNQMIRRRIRKANIQAPGTSGTQTVNMRYPNTAATASSLSTPAKVKNAQGSNTSSALTPPKPGTTVDSDETIT
jgi:hypothetical protein